MISISPQGVATMVLAQASEIGVVADGLEKNPVTYACALLLFVVWALYRETNELRAKLITTIERNAEDKVALAKDTNGLAQQLVNAVEVLKDISDRFPHGS